MRKSAQGFTLIEIMVVIAIIAGLIGTVVILVPQMQERQRRLTCQQNLRQLGTMYVTMRSEKMGKPPYDGQALFLSWRTKAGIIKKGSESVLICPGDNGVTVPNTPELQAKYDDIDLANAPLDMCSYAVRNFTQHPISVESPTNEVIACDRNGSDGRTAHHQDGVNMVFDDASCRLLNREELGVSADSPIVVGPESSNDQLKKVVYNVQRKE